MGAHAEGRVELELGSEEEKEVEGWTIWGPSRQRRLWHAISYRTGAG